MLRDLGAGRRRPDQPPQPSTRHGPARPAAGRPRLLPLGERLARAAAAGARCGSWWPAGCWPRPCPWALLGDFRANVDCARRLRAWHQPALARAAGRPVLVDFTGSLLGSNHQKVVVVSKRRRADGVRRRHRPRGQALRHRTARAAAPRGARWGWHDWPCACAGRPPSACGTSSRALGRGAHVAAQALPARRLQMASPSTRRRSRRGPARSAAPGPGAGPGTSVRVLRSLSAAQVRLAAAVAAHRLAAALPRTGVHEIYLTLCRRHRRRAALRLHRGPVLRRVARRRPPVRAVPALRAAAARGVKVILVGSGHPRPGRPGLHVADQPQRSTATCARKIVDRLDPQHRANVAVYRVEHLTVHAKLVLIDDRSPASARRTCSAGRWAAWTPS